MKYEDNKTGKMSKLFIFFELIYRLLIVNIFTFFLILPIFTSLPAIVAAYATLKNGIDDTKVIKSYFKNFSFYFWKSFKIGLILLVAIAVVLYAFFFYRYQDAIIDFEEIWYQIGMAVILILMLILVLVSVNLPLLVITFKKLTVIETIKTSFYITFRYFITTLILFLMLIFQIVGIVAFPIWIILGISLPIMLSIRFTAVVYKKFELIDLEKIMHIDLEEEDE